MVEGFRVKHTNTMRGYTRATCLNWDARISALVFGSTITEHFRKKTRRYGLAFAGVLGRPLYACGAQKPVSDSATSTASSTFCENPASMSPLLQFKGERLLWRCAACIQADVPASTSRRIIRLCPVVRTIAGHVTPMRDKALSVALHPPLENWQ